MPYRVLSKDGIKTLATGQRWNNGAVIGDTALMPHIMEALLAEGAIEPIDTAPAVNADPLLNVPYMTDEIANGLRAIGIETVAALAGATVDTVSGLYGVGKTTAGRIIKGAQKVMEDADAA